MSHCRPRRSRPRPRRGRVGTPERACGASGGAHAPWRTRPRRRTGPRSTLLYCAGSGRMAPRSPTEGATEEPDNVGRVGRLGRLRVGFLAGHLHSTDEVRHVAELADGLAGDGHQVVVYTRSVARTTIPWIDHRFDIRPVADGRHDPLDVLCFCHAMDWFLVGTFTNVRRSVYYAIEPEDTDGMIGVHDAPHAAVDLQIASSPAVASALEARTGRRPEIVLPGLDLELFAPGDDGRRARGLDAKARRWTRRPPRSPPCSGSACASGCHGVRPASSRADRRQPRRRAVALLALRHWSTGGWLG